MDFGDALRHLKEGKRVRRIGWNGKGMFIYLSEKTTMSFEKCGSVYQKSPADPCVVMFTSQNTYQPGWLASQADMLAKDWELLDES